MADNWIKQRAMRERNLDGCAIKLWHEVATMLDDSCTAFNEDGEYSKIGKMENSPENGHRIIVTITYANPNRKIAYVTFQLDEQKPRISVIAKESTRQFPIDADDAGCFIKSPAGDKLSINEFGKTALEDVLFKNPSPAPRSPKRGGSGVSAWG